MPVTYPKEFWRRSIQRASSEIEMLNADIEISETYIQEKKERMKGLRKAIAVAKSRMKTAPDV